MKMAVAFMEDPRGRHWGYDLSRKAGLRSGIVYPALSRMLDDGWLTDGWEDQWQGGKKRPPRRYYELTDRGRRELGALADAAAADPRWSGLINPGMA